MQQHGASRVISSQEQSKTSTKETLKSFTGATPET